MALQTKSKKLGVHTEYNSAVLQNFIALKNVSILTTPKLISFGHNGLMVQEKQCVKFTNRVQSTSNVVDYLPFIIGSDTLVKFKLGTSL